MLGYYLLLIGLATLWPHSVARQTEHQSEPPRVDIRIQPHTVHLGDSALLTWNATGVDSVYISHIGHVPASGILKIAPRITTLYTVLAEHNGKNISKSATLTISGARGGSEFPDHSTPFFYPLQEQRPAPSLPALLDRIRRVLQNTYSLSVDEYSISRMTEYVFLTTRSERTDLLDPSDRTIRGRRIAFRVIVSLTPHADREYHYSVATLVEYRKKLVRKWKVEDNPKVSVAEARRLADRINAAR